MNWILRPPMRCPCARTYATKPRLTSIGGAEFGPLNVSRLPILSGFVADFRAIPAHAPGEAANGALATATPIPARFRNSRRSKDRVVLSSPLTLVSFLYLYGGSRSPSALDPTAFVAEIVANLVAPLPYARRAVTLLAANFFDQNFTSILNGVALGMLIFVLAIGLSLIFGMLDVLNLAHGSLYLLGSYLGYELVENHGVPFVLAAAISIVFGVGLGLVLGAFLRPMRGRGHLDQVLLT